MKKSKLAIIFALVIFGSLIVIMSVVRLSSWIYKQSHPSKSRFVTKEAIPLCDALEVREEFLHRKKCLVIWNPNWLKESALSLQLEITQNSKGDCSKGLQTREFYGDPEFGYIHEREIYASDKKLIVFDSDVPGGTQDTTCECLVIDFLYCEAETKYEFYTGKPFEKFSDGVFSKSIDRPAADSILKSWGIKRELPPEDFEWLYREEQLNKAMQKKKKK